MLRSRSSVSRVLVVSTSRWRLGLHWGPMEQSRMLSTSRHPPSAAESITMHAPSHPTGTPSRTNLLSLIDVALFSLRGLGAMGDRGGVAITVALACWCDRVAVHCDPTPTKRKASSSAYNLWLPLHGVWLRLISERESDNCDTRTARRNVSLLRRQSSN